MSKKTQSCGNRTGFYLLKPEWKVWENGLKVVLSVQILHQEEDSLSASQKTEVSPVSQAWFTTKEDKDTLANKGAHNGTTSTQHTAF